MALDLFCYTTLPAGEATEVLAKLQRRRPDIFPDCWWLSEVCSDWVGDDPPAEYGFRASSFFLVHWQKNDWGPMSAGVVRLLEDVFGRGRVLALLNGETPIEPAPPE